MNLRHFYAYAKSLNKPCFGALKRIKCSATDNSSRKFICNAENHLSATFIGQRRAILY